VKAIIRKDGKILLIKNSYDRLLYLPGGGVRKSETAEKAIRREIMEETGVMISKCHLIGKYTSTREYKKDFISLFYVDAFKAGERSKSMEIDTAVFYTVDKLPDNVSQATLRRINANPQKIEKGEW